MASKGKQKQKKLFSVKEVLLIAGLIAGLYWLLAPGQDRSFRPVAIDDLKGVWTTTAPQYSDRFLEFSEGILSIGRGEAGIASYSIDDIDSEPTDAGTLVHVRYLDLESVPYDLNFYYQNSRGGVIYLKNQKNIYWYREQPEPVHTPVFK